MGKLTPKQTATLRDVAINSYGIGVRPYTVPAKRMFGRLERMGLIVPFRTSGIGRSAVTYYIVSDEGRAALASRKEGETM